MECKECGHPLSGHAPRVGCCYFRAIDGDYCQCNASGEGEVS